MSNSAFFHVLFIDVFSCINVEESRIWLLESRKFWTLHVHVHQRNLRSSNKQFLVVRTSSTCTWGSCSCICSTNFSCSCRKFYVKCIENFLDYCALYKCILLLSLLSSLPLLTQCSTSEAAYIILVSIIHWWEPCMQLHDTFFPFYKIIILQFFFSLLFFFFSSPLWSLMHHLANNANHS